MDEQEKREKEREAFRRTGGTVTRIEFYVCFVVLIAVVLWRGGATSQNLMTRMISAERNITHQIDSCWNDINREIDAVPERVREEQENPFREERMEVAGIDRKAGTFRLALQATPKEYRDGMEGLFYVSCDDGERTILHGVIDEDGTLRAETELPLCGKVSTTAIWRADGVEKVRHLDDMDVERETTPTFDGRTGISTDFSKSGTDFKAVDTVVGVACPDRMQHAGFWAGEGKTEIRVDGKAVKTIPMEKEDFGGREWRYCHEGESEAVNVGYGRRVSVVFQMRDGDGTTYSYILEDGVMTKEGLEAIAPESPTPEGKDWRLTIG